MKKIIMVSMIALIAAFGFVGCSEEHFSAKVQWQNNTAVDDAKDIQWVSVSNEPDQTWNETVTQGGDTSEVKSVSLETGKGLCFDPTGSTEYEIEINGGSLTYVLNDGETEVLSITDLTAK